MILSKFQSTLPRGERLRSGTRCRICYDFNPRSHEGSDYGRIKKKPYGGISIHAPTRGATRSKTTILTSKKISIHAPTRGATPLLYPHGILFLDFNPRSHEGSDVCIRVAGYTITYFNPRSHEGSDFSWGSIAVMYTRISIHAPTRGATSPGEDSPLLNTISIHAPTRGATSFRALQTFANGFQSTLPRGERLYVWVAGCTITYFNPRSHEGSDKYGNIFV